MNPIWQPGAYHGHRARPPFFEGWYFKLITADRSRRYAVIPGISLHPDPAQTHTFVQWLDGIAVDSVYTPYPAAAFDAPPGEFAITVGPNRFSADGLTLDLGGERPVRGSLRFTGGEGWPVRPLSPGIMGPFSFAPFMQCYHGVLSFDHVIEGTLEIGGERVDFTGGHGYIEKDWGRAFPRAYVWMQTNHFEGAPGTSFTGSVATIPWLTGWFPGFIVGLRHEGKLYRFATYAGGKTTALRVSGTDVAWRLEGGPRVLPGGAHRAYTLAIHAERAEGAVLAAPTLDGMRGRIVESLTARIGLRLAGTRPDGTEEVLFEGEGTCAGLEVAGTVEELEAAFGG